MDIDWKAIEPPSEQSADAPEQTKRFVRCGASRACLLRHLLHRLLHLLLHRLLHWLLGSDEHLLLHLLLLGSDEHLLLHRLLHRLLGGRGDGQLRLLRPLLHLELDGSCRLIGLLHGDMEGLRRLIDSHLLRWRLLHHYFLLRRRRWRGREAAKDQRQRELHR